MNEEKLLKRKQRALREGNIRQLAEILKQLGDAYFESGQLQESLTQYLEQIEACEALNNKLDCAIAHRMVGEVHASLGNYQEALVHQNEHLEGARELENLLEQQRAFATLGRTYFCFAESLIDKQDEMNEALNNAKKAYSKSIRLCSKLEGTVREDELVTMRARLLLNLGLVRELQKAPDEAVTKIEAAASLCRQYNLTEDLHRTNISLGAFHERQSNYDLALELYEKAANVNSTSMKADAYLVKAELLLKLGEWVEARKPLVNLYIMTNLSSDIRKQAEKMFRIVVSICNAEDSLLIETNIISKQNLYENLGDAAVEVKSYDKAIDYYGKMLMCAEECRSEKVGAALVSLAQTLRDAGQSVEAISYAQRELKLCSDAKDSCRSALQLADLMISAKSEDSEIQKYFNLALSYAQKCNSSKLELSVLREFSDYLDSIGDVNQCEGVKFRLKKLSEFVEIESEDEPESQNIGENICLDDLSDVEEALGNIEGAQKPKRTLKRGFCIKRNEKGESQLQVACIKNDIEAVEKLIEKGHPVNVRDSFGWTPLHEVANYDYVEIAKILIKAGANVNDPGGLSCNALTPLHDAASNGNFSMIYLLLENGANANAITEDGETVIDCLESWRDRVNDLPSDVHKDYLHARRRLLQLLTVDPKNRINFGNQRRKKSIWNEEEEPEVEDRTIEHLETQRKEKISAGEDYKRTIESLKNRGSASSSTKRSKHLKVTAPLLDSEEVLVDDWLEDDIMAPVKKSLPYEMPVRSPPKRSSTESVNMKRSSTDSSNIKRSSTDSSSNGFKRKSNSDNESIESNDSIITEFPKKRRKKQSSLLKSGFTKNTHSRSPSPIFADSSNYPINQMSSCITMNFSILIDYDTYNVTTTFISDRQSIIENIIEDVKRKFEKDTGCKAKLKITTWEGAELLPEVTPNFFLRSDAPIKLRGEIIDMYTPSIVERYRNICKDCKTTIQESTIKSLKVCENSSIFRLNSKEILDEELPALMKSLQYQKNLQTVHLSGGTLFNHGKLLNITIQRLTSLYELHLQNCDIDLEILLQIEKLPHQLRVLNLSYNPLGSRSQEKIYNLLEPLKNLQTLNLRYCKLEEIQFMFMNEALEYLDVSWNALGGEGISRLLQRQMISLSLSNTQSPCSSNLVSKIINNPKYSLFALETLELASCKITDADVRRLLTETPNLTRFVLGGNKDVTKLSVYALLKREPSLFYIDVGGCTKIVDIPSIDVTIVNPEVCTLIISMIENVIDEWENLWRGRGLASKLPHNVVMFKPM